MSAPNRSLFVKGLYEDTTPHALRECFAKYGQIGDIYIPISYHTRRPRGFAYVQFESLDDAKRAVRKLDGTHFHGRELKVEFAQGDRKTPHEMRKKERGSGRESGSRNGRDGSRRRRSRSREGRTDRSSRRERTDRSRSREGRRRSKSRSRDRSSRRQEADRSNRDGVASRGDEPRISRDRRERRNSDRPNNDRNRSDHRDDGNRNRRVSRRSADKDRDEDGDKSPASSRRERSLSNDRIVLEVKAEKRSPEMPDAHIDEESNHSNNNVRRNGNDGRSSESD